MKARYLDAGVNHSPVCGSHWTPGQKEDEATDTLQFRVGHLTFTILPRSTNSIYQLLGKVLLLNIVPADGQAGCFVHTYFFDGDYCVPEHGSSNTKRIFSLLAELLALKTQASDLAITPAVRIIQ